MKYLRRDAQAALAAIEGGWAWERKVGKMERASFLAPKSGDNRHVEMLIEENTPPETARRLVQQAEEARAKHLAKEPYNPCVNFKLLQVK